MPGYDKQAKFSYYGNFAYSYNGAHAISKLYGTTVDHAAVFDIMHHDACNASWKLTFRGVNSDRTFI